MYRLTEKFKREGMNYWSKDNENVHKILNPLGIGYGIDETIIHFYFCTGDGRSKMFRYEFNRFSKEYIRTYTYQETKSCTLETAYILNDTTMEFISEMIKNGYLEVI